MVDQGEKYWCPFDDDAQFPPKPWSEDDLPAAPDYADLASWAAHPAKEGLCPGNDTVPEGEPPVLPRSERPADAFFVHGSILNNKEIWHTPVGDPVLDEDVTATEGEQSACLNVSCRVFAPRYRANTSPSHNHLHHPSQERRHGAPEDYQKYAVSAMDLSYSDVERAFDMFLKQTGDRPIVIGAHSQGSYHAQRLMERFDRDDKLRSRLVCAYILGPCGTFAMDKFERNFPSLKPCKGPLDLGCIVAFDNVSEGFPDLSQVGQWADTFPMRNKGTDPPHNARYVKDGPSSGVWESVQGKQMFCVNPLTWTSDTSKADASLHLGILKCDYVQADGKTPALPSHKNVLQGVQLANVHKEDVGKLGTQIMHDGGVLVQSNIWENIIMHSEWQHFFFNIRENCKQRVGAFLESEA